MSKFLKIFVPALGGTIGTMATAYFLADQFIVNIPAPARLEVVSAAQAQEAPAVEPAIHAALAAPSRAGGFGIGRDALAEEVAAWNTDIRPDGEGLPVGEGDVWTGEEVFVEKCASCHGDFGEAVGRWPQLAGGFDTLSDQDPVKTIGSYWPYLSTVFDYVGRAMPFGASQTLTDDETYAIVAYLLYLNDIVGDDFVLNQDTFATVEMRNTANFYDDDRETSELPLFSVEACMSDCKETVEITMRAAVLDVTPETETTEAEEPVAEEPDEPVAEAVEEPAAEEPAAQETTYDPALVTAGAGVFRRCRSCHEVGDTAGNKTGPHLNNLLGRTAGTIDGFRYSGAMTGAGDDGWVWNTDTLSTYLANPRATIRGTRMSFAGLRTQEEIDAVIAYLAVTGDQ